MQACRETISERSSQIPQALHDVSAFEWLRPTLVRMGPVDHVAGAHTSRPLHVDVGCDFLRPDDDLVRVILQLDGL